ncbi:MAG: amidohydrolase family protein, partial [Arenibacterium sp.]
MQEQYDLIIRNAQIVNAEGRVDGDIAVTDGRISVVGKVAGRAGQEVDAGGKLVLPGGVDPHCHIEQMSGMGQMNADSFETATRSAAMGGTTSVISFAAQAKGQRLRDAVDDYATRARRGAMIDHAFHLSISDCSVPAFESDLGALIDAGHRSVKVFTTYNIRLSDPDILDVMTVARRHGALVCVHAENDALINWTRDQLLVQGKHAPKYHAPSHPRLAEIEAVERMCRFAEFLGQPVMLFHISTSDAVEVIRRAQKRGCPVRAETCPHYLTMGPEVLDAPGIEGAKWMCSPPQRGESDREALWRALVEGDLQIVSSDHAPYRFDETGKLSAGKDARFDQIANGMPGLQTRLPVMFDEIVSRGRGGVEDFV